MRIWLIVARFCALAVWQDDKKNLFTSLQTHGLTFRLVKGTLNAWWTFKLFDWSLWIAEFGADRLATWNNVKIYWRGKTPREDQVSDHSDSTEEHNVAVV